MPKVSSPYAARQHPSCNLAIFDLGETRVLNHFGKLFLPRKFTNALDEILIAVPVARQNLTQARDDGETIGVVKGADDFGRRRCKFEE